jgi:general secretion pathway protein A
MAIYLGYYGLEKDPFGATPDPEFLFMTPKHREALAQLTYAIQERKGFMLLTAEVGMGKTTLLNALRDQLESTTAVACVTNSMLPFQGILEYMLEEFEIVKPGETHAQRLVSLQNFLLERFRAGQNTVLILDEAQNLYPQTLEQIRLLSNFETTKEKILQIVLAGQPELRAKLEMEELRQLNQRIAMRCTIPPLSASGTRNYIRMRLRHAGATDSGLFSEEALARIAEHAGGIPRVVNTTCDHCLLIGYAEQTRRIGVPIVEEAIAYMEDGRRPRQRPGLAARRRRPVARTGRSGLRWALAGMAAAVVAAGITLGALHVDTVRDAVDASADSLSRVVRAATEAIRR